jgi:CBS domain-containing protein
MRLVMKVCDAMKADVQLCTPDDTLKDAAEAMAALGVGLLPVTDGERLVGMISDRDIAIRGVATGRGPDSRVGDVMTSDVKYCFDHQEIGEVIENMGDVQVRRLPVLNRDKRLEGIVALCDLARTNPGNGTSKALERVSQPGGQHAQTWRKRIGAPVREGMRSLREEMHGSVTAVGYRCRDSRRGSRTRLLAHDLRRV